MRTLHGFPYVLEAARHGTLLGLLALVALVVEFMLFAIALRRAWLARRAPRAPSSCRPRRWPEVLGAAALLLVPLAGLVAAEGERQRALRIFATPPVDPHTALRELTGAVVGESATLWFSVMAVIVVALIGVPALLLAGAARRTLRGEPAGGPSWLRVATPLLAFGLGLLPWLVGARGLLDQLVDERLFGGYGDPAQMLLIALDEITAAERSFGRWAVLAAGGLGAALGLHAWHVVATRRLPWAVRSWRATLVVCAGCAIVVAASLGAARRYAWENAHPLPAVERDFGRRLAPATFEPVGGDFDSARALARAEREDPSRSLTLIGVVAGTPGGVTVDDVALSRDEAAEVLTQKRQLWQAVNPSREFPGALALYSDGTRPLADVAGGLCSAARAGFGTVWLLIPHSEPHDRPLLGRFRVLHFSGLRAAIADRTRPPGDAVALRLEGALTYEELARRVAAARASGREVALRVDGARGCGDR